MLSLLDGEVEIKTSYVGSRYLGPFCWIIIHATFVFDVDIETVVFITHALECGELVINVHSQARSKQARIDARA